MANFTPSPYKPDGRIFASYPMPAKIDLINSKPRRESLIEQRLESPMGEPVVPVIEVSEQQTTRTTDSFTSTRDPRGSSNYGPSPAVNYTNNNSNNNINNTRNMHLTSNINTANNRRSPSQELADKEAKLLKEIEEMERKPYNPQTMVVQREEWYEYPPGNPNDRSMMDSKRRVKDFCSMPSHMYPQQGQSVHEDLQLNSLSRPVSVTPGSIHTAIIRSPAREIDNKSPLPFAFDNFTTKGVRGNIATVGAIEPDRPRAPIYPIVKRSPSPNVASYRI